MDIDKFTNCFLSGVLVGLSLVLLQIIHLFLISKSIPPSNRNSSSLIKARLRPTNYKVKYT